MTHPLVLTDPGLASQAQSIKPDRCRAAGWALVKEAVELRRVTDNPVWDVIYRMLVNGDMPDEKQVEQARAELAQRHVDQLALRAELHGRVPPLGHGMVPNAFTVASFAEDTWRLRALLMLCEDGWDKERVLDLVQCLVNGGVDRDALSARLHAAGA